MANQEFELNGENYKIDKIPAMEQIQLFWKVMPLFSKMLPSMPSTEPGTSIDLKSVDMTLVLDAIASMSSENLDYVINKCLSYVRRKDHGVYNRIDINGKLAYEDINGMDMLNITMNVLLYTLEDFFSEKV